MSDVTIVVVPRERFAVTRRSLESIYRETEPPFALVYVDGGSPPETRRYLEARARASGFRLLRVDRYLAPNEARNIGVGEVTTRYVVFVDNDVLVTPGWLRALVDCAEETGAWVVGPLYCQGELAAPTVHMTGGHARIFERHGVRRFLEDHRFHSAPLSAVRHRLEREPCDMVEFHCLLMRTDVVSRLGPLDERLKSALENPDLCMSVRAAGGRVYFEPAALVTYLPPPPLAPSDRPYFELRWSDEWNRASLRHFQGKWQLPANDPNLRRQLKAWTWWRRRGLAAPGSMLARALESRFGISLAWWLNAVEARTGRGGAGYRAHPPE